QVEVELLPGNLRFAARNREHDPKTHCDNQPNDDPGSGHLTENPAVPQRQQCANQQDEVPDEIHVDETHGDLTEKDGKPKVKEAKTPPFPSVFRLQPSGAVDYRVTRT